MTGTIRAKKRVNDQGEWEQVPEFLLDGQVVTEAEFLEKFPDGEFDATRIHFSGLAGWPIVSNAAAVHPKKRDEAIAHDKALGVPTNYTPDGSPIFTDRGHRKRFLKAHGFRDNSGGYGD